ncbi:LacI family DNA-binding transcriptional regulator [Leifsonia sp. Leaf264]|uniref:LacI family DNA-binding transcriptional regulator n=1 Tax=Leifsonia sp. Leaf264 TaxID=1736314 RepID=UPI0006F5F6D2|nr:LacI family DNA-binding transcriptional regulator [Leifsonia sp. Leaf264]KQO97480.1 LacI family transcriptional regulator [Leifsonia sp. Leaf264]
MRVVKAGPKAGPNPSVEDVARLAGVSRGTVSNVLNYPERVIPSKVERVRAAINELGYVRNDAARALAAGQSESIGFVVADIENSLFIDMIHGAQDRAKDAGRSMLLGNAECDLGQQNSYLDLFDETRVAGLLLAPMEDSSDGVKRMRSHGRQIVLLNYDPNDDKCCAVLVDNEMVGYLAAAHLIELGRTHLAYVAGHDSYQPVHARRVGMRRAVEEAGPAVTLTEVDTAGLLAADGAAYAEDYLALASADRPDGVVCVTDDIAHGFITGLLAGSSLRVPEDVAVIGCENNRSVVSGPIALTTVVPPGREMGVAASALLFEEIENGDDHVHRTEVFEPTLVGRESTIGRDLALAQGR